MKRHHHNHLNNHNHFDHPAHPYHPDYPSHPLLENFYVVTVISNPARFKSRYELYRRFEKHMQDSGVKLYTVEMAFGERRHEITSVDNPYHIQLRSENELWHKENMINIGVSRLPTNWKYVAWIDADVTFARPDWAIETVHQLQHYHVVQMFSEAIDLGPNYQVIGEPQAGFCYKWHKEDFFFTQKRFITVTEQDGPPYYYASSNTKSHKDYWHPGYAWAMTREAFDAVGGLMDFPILGSADHHMAMALIGQAENSVHSKAPKSYMDEVKTWEKRALRHIKKDIGYVDGMLYHFWHGNKKNRKYVGRWDILTENEFELRTDIKRDSQGLWQICDIEERQIRLRDQIRAYFRQRNEDDISLY